MKTYKLAIMTTALALSAAVQLHAADVKANWDKHCASCHAKDGTGNTKMGKKAEVKDYTDAKVQAAMVDDKAFKAIKEGMVEKGKERMKPFRDKLTDAEIKALIEHMRTFAKAK